MLAMVLLAGTSVSAQTAPAPVVRRTAYEDLQMFGQVLNQIRVNHPDSVDPHELFMAAVEGMIHAADPHSYVIPAMRLEPGKEQAMRDGKLVPVPITFDFIGGAPVVVSVAAGTQARLLDILPGDELTSIDGKPVLSNSGEELDIILAGPKSSTVRLVFERRRSDGTFAQLDRAVKREKVNDATAVPVSTMLDASTGYVRVTTFVGERVADDLHSALDKLEKGGMQRLVLDLRDNGGGSVAEAARVAGEFLPRGAVVYSSSGRKTEVTDTGRVSRSFWQSERRYPIVVMVNAGTASASELVAGALQDHDRALIVGRPTFGKSLLMRGFPMADGSVLVLVIGQVRTPCGRVVQREYRTISRREYYRMARAERDTAGRPSCKTDAGRVAYGGGGIYPDVMLPAELARPRWLVRADEQQLAMSWSGSYIDANRATLTTLDAFMAASLSPATLADFRSFASKQGVDVPADADDVVQQSLRQSIAYAKWGAEGAYRVDVGRDQAIKDAVASFSEASKLLNGGH
ncbi:MAG: peptidase [Gemmatimonadetes bacterium]|nr:peptidase [Gemmatimonadota bacterium]